MSQPCPRGSLTWPSRLATVESALVSNSGRARAVVKGLGPDPSLVFTKLPVSNFDPSCHAPCRQPSLAPITCRPG